MSDWRSRATPISQGPAPASALGGWRSRATPDAPSAAPEQGGGQMGDAAQTALEQYGNTATLGYLPQIQAATQPIMDRALNLVTGNDVEPAHYSDYVNTRDENIRRMAEMSKAHPIASKLGTGAGIVGGALLTPGLSAVKGLGQLAVQGAKTGAVYGGMANPGDVEGELSGLQLPDRLENAGKGMALGAIAPVALTGLAKGASKAGKFLGDKAARKATRALGQPTQKVAEEMRRTGEDVAIGRELLDQGAIPKFGTPKRILRRIEAMKDKTWAAVEDLLDKGGANPVVDGADAGLKLLQSPELALLKKTPGAEATVSAIESAAETLAKNGKLTLRESQAVKKSIDKQIKYNRGIPDLQGKQQAMFAGRTALRDTMDDAVGALGPGPGALKAAFKKHGRLEKGSDLAEKEIARTQKNRAISLTDTVVGAGGAMFGDTPIEKTAWMTALALLNKGGRTFGNSLQARGYNAASKGAASLAPLAMKGAQSAPLAAASLPRLTGPENSSESTDPILHDQKLMQFFQQYPNLIEAMVPDHDRAEAIRKRIQRKPAKGSP